MNGKRITMRTIAESCHVSIATVSRALHGSAGVNENLANQIRSFAMAQGYMPNRSAQSLRLHRSNVVYIVSRIGKDGRSPLQIPSNSRLKSMLGIDIRVHPILMNDDLIDKLTWLEHNGIPRLCVIVGPCLVKDARKFDSIRTPLLFVESDDAPAQYASVTSDNEQGAEIMVNSLINAGHRRIAALTVEQAGRISYEERLNGYRTALERNDIAYDPLLVLPVPVETDNVFASVERFLNTQIVPAMQACPQPPTAVFVLSDFLALVLFRVATNIGVRIPEDLSVASFGGWNVTRYLPVVIQSWVQPTSDIIEASARAMSCMLDKKPFPATLALTDEHPDGSFGSAFATSARHMIVRGYLRQGNSIVLPPPPPSEGGRISGFYQSLQHIELSWGDTRRDARYDGMTVGGIRTGDRCRRPDTSITGSRLQRHATLMHFPLKEARLFTCTQVHFGTIAQ